MIRMRESATDRLRVLEQVVMALTRTVDGANRKFFVSPIASTYPQSGHFYLAENRTVLFGLDSVATRLCNTAVTDDNGAVCGIATAL